MVIALIRLLTRSIAVHVERAAFKAFTATMEIVPVLEV